MKKIIKLFIIIIILVIAPKVLALDVTTVEGSEDASGKITVTGTAPSDMVAVSIMLYDETGNTFIKMLNTNVFDDNTFSLTFNMEPKTYTIKVADYTGGNFKEVKVYVPGTEPTTPDDTQVDESTENDESTSNNSTTTNDSTNPDTGDKIYIYGIIGGVAVVGLGIAVVVLTKKKK